MRRLMVALTAAVLLTTPAIVAGRTHADAVFNCHAAKGDECAFLIFDERANSLGSSGFVLDSGQSHGVSTQWIGAYYCVNAGPKRQPAPVRPGCCKDDMTRKHKSYVIGAVND